MNKYFFILGGPDREMMAIINILKEQNIPFLQPCEDWEKREILTEDVTDDFLTNKRIHVYVECFPNEKITSSNDIIIDHHNERSNERSSLIQVKNLLGLEITDYDLWIEGWDKAGVYGALKAGAPKETVEGWLKEVYGEEQMKGWFELFKNAELIGETRVIRTQEENLIGIGKVIDLKTYPEKIPLFLISVDNQKPIEYLYFGNPEIAKELYSKFSGFYGGDPASSMYWGIYEPKWKVPRKEEVASLIKS